MSHAMQKTAHEITSQLTATTGAIVGGVVGFIGAAAIDIATGGAALALGINPLSGAIVGAAAGGEVGGAAQQQAATEANVGTYNQPAPSQPGVSPANAPTAPSVVGKSEADIAAEKYQEQQTLLASEQAQLGQTVLGEKVSEVTAEGGIRASAAARGLKLEGSPMMQLLVQQQTGKTAVQMTETQGRAALSAGQEAAQAMYDTSALYGKEQLQYAQQQTDTAWMNAFTFVLGQAQGAVSKFWNPSTAEPAAQSAGYSYSQPLPAGYAGD